MRFSEAFNVTRSSVDDWFDPLLLTDTELFVDPFRIWSDKQPDWHGAHDHLVSFFDMVLGLIAESGGDHLHPAWKKAERLLLFPEPAEFCLGYSEGFPMGSGSGKGLREGIMLGALHARRVGAQVRHVEELTLFQEGIGADRISDITCNILKSTFIVYTQAIAARHAIPMERTLVRNALWQEEFKRWDDGEVDLPVNPYTKFGVILTPWRFLRKLPTVEPDDFWEWSWANENEAIRGDFSYEVSQKVDPSTKARLARLHPEVAARYVLHLEDDPKPPYPIETDPDRRVILWEQSALLAEMAFKAPAPLLPGQFCDFVGHLMAEFKHSIEDSNGWTLLWHNGRGLAEKKVQALMRWGWLHYCKAHDVDVSPEPNAGRGPVDFKFSAGWQSRAVVEVKLMRNRNFWEGLQRQTVQYMRSEQVRCGFFVGIAYTDRDMADERVERVEEVAQRVRQETGFNVTGVVVDARRKPSASQLADDE